MKFASIEHIFKHGENYYCVVERIKNDINGNGRYKVAVFTEADRDAALVTVKGYGTQYAAGRAVDKITNTEV